MSRRRKSSPIWPYLCVLACLFVLSITAPRARERIARHRSLSRVFTESPAPRAEAAQPRDAFRRARGGADRAGSRQRIDCPPVGQPATTGRGTAGRRTASGDGAVRAGATAAARGRHAQHRARENRRRAGAGRSARTGGSAATRHPRARNHREDSGGPRWTPQLPTRRRPTS